MQVPRSDKQSYLLTASASFGLSFLIQLAAPGAAKAQAIPPAPPSTGLYSQSYTQSSAANATTASSALGQAVEDASNIEPAETGGADAAAKADEESDKVQQAISNNKNAGQQGRKTFSMPRISRNGSSQDYESKFLAQAADNSNAQVDLAPVKLPERSNAIFNTNQFQTGILYKLPARMFFQSSTENSIRLETNVLQTYRNNRADFIYRVLPNVTVGYALTKTTRVSANYFFFRDQYTRNKSLLSRNIHSIGFQLNQDIPINDRTAITLGFMGRQLLLSRFQPLSDLLPSVQITRRVGGNTVLYGGILGQIRFRNTLGKFQEGDQFYTLGAIYRKPRYQLLWDNTFITNFGNRKLRFGPDNANMIMTLEADYRISPRLPLVAFVRAQPIFNIGANQAIGFAGFNFRIFGGLRLDLNKAPIFPVNVKRK